MTMHLPLGPPVTTLSAVQVAFICNLVRREAGLGNLSEKRAFLEQRMARRLRAHGLESHDAYLALLSGPLGAAETPRLVEALTTHTTSFFREPGHYDWLAQEGLDRLLGQGAGIERPLTVWSAACSSGAELWSAGMVVDRHEQLLGRRLRWGLIGSDVSRAVLDRAARAIYDETEIGSIPEEFRARGLLRSRARHHGRLLFRITPELRRRSRFFWVNLTADQLPEAGMCDVIFLRNVLIYFDAEGQARALGNVLSRLNPGGILFLGHAESVGDLPADLVKLGPSIYARRDS